MPTPDPARERLPRYVWGAAAVACLTVVYAVLQVVFVRPYLWPAGHGGLTAGDTRLIGGSGDRILIARPPELSDHPIGTTVLRETPPWSRVARAGLRQGDEITAVRRLPDGPWIDLSGAMTADGAAQLRIWRDTYWLGLNGPLEVRASDRDNNAPKIATLERIGAWRLAGDVVGEWSYRHLGMMVQIVVFTAAAVTLLLLRSTDITAAVAVLALAFCAVGGGGPLMGAERLLPRPLSGVMTVFAWCAAPIAFSLTGLAILYFPRKSQLLARYPLLHVAPFLPTLPMLATALGTSAFIVGMDAAERVALWDATHANVYYGAFAAAAAMNVLIVAEGLRRYRRNPDQNERRRIRIVVLTGVPGIIGFAIKDGLPAMNQLLVGRDTPVPGELAAFLQLLVLLPAISLTYAVAVHRVLSPRVVLRLGMQYALARNSLRALAALPVAALAIAVVRNPDRTVAQILGDSPVLFGIVAAVGIAGYRYGDRLRQWLDQRFFREEYDARKVLVSLASRVRYETDPSDLTSVVLAEIDAALHPQSCGMLISGIEEGRFTPVAALGGELEPLEISGALATMLRWSEEPLDVDVIDPRSPARRLPANEREWLARTRISLLVPVTGEDRAPVGVLALGGKRSEEPYTSEDRELLASIAAQIGLGLDVTRLRRRLVETHGELSTGTIAERATAVPLNECPRCGRCEDAGTTTCPADGAAMVAVASLPRTVDNKYRVDQLLGRGGMGAVYRCRDVRLDRDVALKVVRADRLDRPDARRRFRREAQLVARLQHPSIVSVFDYGTLANGGAYLVMELVRGEDLRAVLRRQGRFTPERTALLLQAICSAIDAAHHEGVLHRDLKPENILLAGGDRPKVLDFGVAKLIDTDAGAGTVTGSVTIDGGIVGTPAYMAPEQLQAGELGPFTDIFSLGVVAYEMLTGELPFGAVSIGDIAMRQIQGPPPMRAGASVASELEEAVRSALRTDPTDRPQSASEFANRLSAAVAGPVT